MGDQIDRQEAIRIITSYNGVVDKSVAKRLLLQMPSAPTELSNNSPKLDNKNGELISRQDAIDSINAYLGLSAVSRTIQNMTSIQEILENLPSAEPEKEIPRRVLWSGWKGTRYTRYKCPNCNKPVKNDDVYCHRCGQKLMFPHISHTPYIEGQKQELIVRWDDEE